MFGLPRMNKKGGIPAINELVMFFLNVTPRPILLLLFVLLIGVISSFIMPVLLNSFGYECLESSTGSLRLYKVPMQSIYKKTGLNIGDSLNDFFTLTDLSEPPLPHPNGNFSLYRINDICVVNEEINGSVQRGYTAGTTDCDFQGFWRDSEKICLGDGFAISSFSAKILSVFDKAYYSSCVPPEFYYYNHTTFKEVGAYYTIINQSDIGIVQSGGLDSQYEQNIIDIGGVAISQESDELVNIQCLEVSKPQVFIFNIQLFDKTLWLILIIGSGVITFFWSYYTMML